MPPSEIGSRSVTYLAPAIDRIRTRPPGLTPARVSTGAPGKVSRGRVRRCRDIDDECQLIGHGAPPLRVQGRRPIRNPHVCGGLFLRTPGYSAQALLLSPSAVDDYDMVARAINPQGIDLRQSAGEPGGVAGAESAAHL